MVRTPGFGLMELLACLALVAALAGAGALRLPDLLASLRASGAAHRLAAALRQARGQALERGGSIEVRLDDGQSLWEVHDPLGATLAREALPPGVRFVALPDARRIRFSGLGGADNATIALGAGASVHRIVVNQRGRVRVQ